jgi:hypothetical protein
LGTLSAAWEAYSRLAAQEVPHHLWHQNLQYHVYEKQSLAKPKPMATPSLINYFKPSLSKHDIID